MNNKEKAGSLAKRLQYLRKLQGWSQAQLAEISGVDISTIQKLEVGISSGREITRQKLADALNTSVAYLVYGEGEPNFTHLFEDKSTSSTSARRMGLDESRKELIERVMEDEYLKESDKEMLVLIIHNRYREAEAASKEKSVSDSKE
ncbi:MAG TPA: helix-turn-helix transcriptional regulator [Chloroflexia bacterium]|nr:helix-turn-helix transcriptional regulator [Chloroflexia bacterium]